jgi:hypothetical protein
MPIISCGAELVAHAERSSPRSFAPPAPFWSTEDKGTASATSWWPQPRRGPPSAPLVKACGLRKAPLSYDRREPLVAHLVILNMTVLSRPATSSLAACSSIQYPNVGRRAADSMYKDMMYKMTIKTNKNRVEYENHERMLLHTKTKKS